MDVSVNAEVRQLKDAITQAVEDNKVEYWLIRQDFDNTGNLKDIYSNRFF